MMLVIKIMVCEERDFSSLIPSTSRCNITGWGYTMMTKLTYKDKTGKPLITSSGLLPCTNKFVWPCICYMSGRFRYSSFITVWRIIG